MQLQSILSEMLDLLLYKRVLKEETAIDYFDWLLAEGLDSVNWNNRKTFELNVEIDTANTERFNAELERLKDSKDYEEKGYFEDKTFKEFRKDFKAYVRNQRDLEKDIVKKALIMFDLYCSRFVKNLDEPRRIDGYILPTFKKVANWKSKNSPEERKGFKSTVSF